MLRVPCSEVSQTQLTLPLRFGGCGLTRVSDFVSLASFAGKKGFSRQWQRACPFPSNVLCRFKRATAAHVAGDLLPPQFLLPRLWPAENGLHAKVEPQWLKLDCWSEKMQQFRRGSLFPNVQGGIWSSCSANIYPQSARGSRPFPPPLWVWRFPQQFIALVARPAAFDSIRHTVGLPFFAVIRVTSFAVLSFFKKKGAEYKNGPTKKMSEKATKVLLNTSKPFFSDKTHKNDFFLLHKPQNISQKQTKKRSYDQK